MSELREGSHAGEFILWEADPIYSRDNVSVTVPAGTTLKAGAVLTQSGGYYIPMTTQLVDVSTTSVGILYAPITNEDKVSPANMDGVIINAVAAVQGDYLDWNGQGAEAQDDAIELLLAQGVKVRDYNPTLGS